MTARSVPSRPPPRGRALAVFGLVAYLSGLGWFATLLTASLGIWEGGHRVRIEMGPAGMRVVMAHDDEHAAVHPRRLSVPALAVFAKPACPATTDHVFEFGPSGGVMARVDATRTLPGSGTIRVALPMPATAWIPVMPVAPPFVAPDTVAHSLAASVRVARTHVLRC